MDIAILMKFGFFILMLFIAGIYCMLVTRNLMRTLIGLELLTKAVTLLLVVAGHVTGRLALTQALVITLIVIEVVVVAIAAGLILSLHRYTDSLNSRAIDSLKG